MMLDNNGSKGPILYVERAFTISGVQPFTYESSAGNSVCHSGSIRLRKRLAHGIAVSGTYAYSKSIDDASSIGGCSTGCARNPSYMATRRGASPFAHRLSSTPAWLYLQPTCAN